MEEDEPKLAPEKRQQTGFRPESQLSTQKAFYKFLQKDAQIEIKVETPKQVQMSLFDYKETA